MTVVLGAGVGVWLTAIFWCLAILSCLVSTKATGKSRTIAVVIFAVLALIPLILIALAALGQTVDTSAPITYEYLTRVRHALIFVGCLFIVLALVFVLVTHVMQPIYAKPLKSKMN